MSQRKRFHEITKLPEFERDFKKLQKKFRTLESDFETFHNTAVFGYHKLDHLNVGIVPISDLAIPYPKINKAKKFACKSLRGKGSRTGLRVIYAYYPDLDKIEYIEIYYKPDQENEDRERIKRYYSKK